MADLDRVREALRASMTAWATLELRGDQARVVPAPDLDTLVTQLERVDPAWSIVWACDSVQPFVVRVTLGLMGTQRGGLASAPTLHDARRAALAEAARAYGVAAPSEGHWVEYDPEDGPNTADLEGVHLDGVPAETEPTRAPAPLPPEPPRDPQMDKARRHIDEMIEQLKAAGKGGQAARVLMRGYGETLDESRAVYKELQTLLKG